MTLFQEEVDSLTRATTRIELSVMRIFSEMTLKEKLSMLDGDEMPGTFLYRTATEGYCHTPVKAAVSARLGLPGIRFSDGPRGCNEGTAFPCPSSRANTWNPDLEEQIVSALLDLAHHH